LLMGFLHCCFILPFTIFCLLLLLSLLESMYFIVSPPPPSPTPTHPKVIDLCRVVSLQVFPYSEAFLSAVSFPLHLSAFARILSCCIGSYWT
ncbi:hypothetical protein DFP73DRAFT_532882, partial [Morchella snyderi]